LDTDKTNYGMLKSDKLNAFSDTDIQGGAKKVEHACFM